MTDVMTDLITYDKFIAGLEEIVKEAGENYVYPDSHRDSAYQCRYVHDDKPDCIIGRFAHRHGVSIETLRSFEGYGAHWMLARVLNVTEKVRNAAAQAQKSQDNESTWGEALERAKTHTPHHNDDTLKVDPDRSP